MTKTSIKIIDCTLRDGGYYNNWDFDPDLTKTYISALSELGIDYIEIGFRFIDNNGFKGPYAFSRDDFISNLKLPKKIKIGVMINAQDVIKHGTYKKNIEKLIPNSKLNSPISLIRFAIHYHELNEFVKTLPLIKSKGFKIGINLMQISNRDENEIKNFVRVIKKFNVDILYFADSTGSCDPNDIKKIIDLIKLDWSGPIGIHAHDNMNKALINSLTAINEGVTWIDSTILGMGRGPGNLKTEEIILEKILNKNYNILPTIQLISKFFIPLKNKYKWGANIFYHLSGLYKIHPTYIQKMISDIRFSDIDIYSSINYLKEIKAISFNPMNIEDPKLFFSNNYEGSFLPISHFKNKEIIIIGPGESVFKHKYPIENYIKIKKHIVFVLNHTSILKESLIDYRIACNPIRLLSDHKQYIKNKTRLILPIRSMDLHLKNKLFNKKEILDFGVKLKKNAFNFYTNYCVLDKPLVFSYALAIAASGKVKNITLAGFDGYPDGDPRNLETKIILDRFYAKSKIKITSITKTKHNIKTKSIYCI